MADPDEHANLRDVIDKQLRVLEYLTEQEHRITSSVMSKIPKELSDSKEAKDLSSSMETLKMSREDMRMRLIHMCETLEANDNIESESKIPKETQRNRRKEDFSGKRTRYMTNQCVQSKEEALTDVPDHLKHRAPELEEHLYSLLAQLITVIPRSKEEVTRYDEFKSCLKWLNKDSGNKIVRAILDLLKGFKKQVGKLGSSVQKVEKGGRVDELLNQLLDNIQLVAFLVDQSGCAKHDIYLLGNRIEECEAEQMEIESKINALKMD